MELSLIIPGRNEMFLSRTIQSILDASEADTEIIAVLDGAWAEPQIPQHPRVTVVYVPESIGQRAATNLGARLSKAKYIAKCDAHCSFDKGFDRKMIEFMKQVGDDVTAVPIMKNLHAFNWVCKDCQWTKYQGPTPEKCEKCSSKNVVREMVWQPKAHVNSTSYCFDSEPHFQYFEDWKHREPYLTDKKTKGYTETMGLQGSFFMCTRDKYWELDLGGEEFGSWGGQGLQVACDTWLSGGRVLVNHKTWYSHMFRTQGKGFSFPYPQSGKHVSRTKRRVWEAIKNKKRPKQIRTVSWLLDKFAPVPGWTEEQIKDLKEFESKL